MWPSPEGPAALSRQRRELPRRLGRARESILAPLLHELEDERVPLLRHVRALARDRAHRARRAAGERLVEHLSEREEIRAPVDLAALLLGRHVRGRPGEERPGRRERARERVRERPLALLGRADRPDPEVRDAQESEAVEEDVRRLQVAVHDPARVRVLERFENRRRERAHALEREAPPLREQVRERAALEPFHGEVGERPLERRLFDPHDPRVLERLEDLRLAHEPRRHVEARDLQGDAPPVLAAREVDGRLPAAPERALDLEAANARPGLDLFFRREEEAHLRRLRAERVRHGVGARREEPPRVRAGCQVFFVEVERVDAHGAPPKSFSMSACAARIRAPTVFRSRPTVSAISSSVSSPW